MSVLVSVIVPCYNVEAYLEECVNSILASTFQDYELLLIDDGSTDQTGAICDTLAERSDKIKVFHTKNGGLCAARNLGIDNAAGEYISFVDGDDLISPHMLERLVAEMQDDIQLVSCSFVRCKREDERHESNKLHTVCKADRKTCARKILMDGFGSYVWNKLWRKSILDAHGIRFRTGRYAIEDQFFTMDYLPYCKQAVFLNAALYYYVMNDGSIMNTFRDNRWISDKYVTLPRAWAYTAEVVAPLEDDLEVYAQSRAAMFYQTVLRKLAQPDSIFTEEAITYVRQHRRTLLHYSWGFKYYLSALLLCASYPLWAKTFRQKLDATRKLK